MCIFVFSHFRIFSNLDSVHWLIRVTSAWKRGCDSCVSIDVSWYSLGAALLCRVCRRRLLYSNSKSIAPLPTRPHFRKKVFFSSFFPPANSEPPVFLEISHLSGKNKSKIGFQGREVIFFLFLIKNADCKLYLKIWWEIYVSLLSPDFPEETCQRLNISSAPQPSINRKKWKGTTKWKKGWPFLNSLMPTFSHEHRAWWKKRKRVPKKSVQDKNKQRIGIPAWSLSFQPLSVLFWSRY